MGIDNIKLHKGTPDGFAFGEPNLVSDYEFNFASDWVLNPNNLEGISIENNVIKITKVKPNTWFIRSNYGFTTAGQRNEKFYNKNWIINGLSKANSDGLIGDGYTFFTNWDGSLCKGWGLVISPVNSSNALMCTTNDGCNQMGIYGGGFKNGWGDWPGAMNFGTRQDGQRALYDSNVNGYDSYGEVALCFFSSVEAGEDDYITFSAPITIGCLMLAQSIDPTTKEAFSIALGKDMLYEKEKNFENLLMKHGLAFLDDEVNSSGQVHFQETIQGDWGDEINDMKDGKKYAYVISTGRGKDGLYNLPADSNGDGIRRYKGTGMPISIPVTTDLFEMLDAGEPVKFFVQQTDKNKKEGLWYNVVKYFKEHDINTQFGATYLFAKSNVNGSDYTDGDGWLDLNIGWVGGGCIDGCFDHAGNGYRNSGVERVRFIVNRGSITKARNVFRFNKYRLKEVEFINNANPNEHVCPDQMSGMFEFCGLSEFPKGLGFSNGEARSELSQTTCFMPYVAHGSAFETFGNYKPDGSEYEIILDPTCCFAFDTRYSPNDGPANRLKNILVILDMKFVDPVKSDMVDSVFQCSNLQKAKIKNLNHGTWSLDNVIHGGVIQGNLESLDADSTNYLLSNVFDLRLNATHTVEDGHEYKAGNLSSRLYLPASLKERASKEALTTAKERGWTIYFGGEEAII